MCSSTPPKSVSTATWRVALQRPEGKEKFGAEAQRASTPAAAECRKTRNTRPASAPNVMLNHTDYETEKMRTGRGRQVSAIVKVKVKVHVKVTLGRIG